MVTLPRNRGGPPGSMDSDGTSRDPAREVLVPTFRTFTMGLLAAMLGGALALGLIGCSNKDRDANAPQRTPSTQSESVDRRAAATRDAIAAYTGMWMAMAKAAETSNPDDPELRRYAAGDALALLVG